ncbi:ribonuclease P protein component [Niabella terrae]
MKTYGLPPSRRLKSSKQLQAVFDSGKRFRGKSVRLIFLNDTGNAGLKFGVGVSSRNFKRAVDRNRIKRILREICRLQQEPLRNWTEAHHCSLAVFLLYTGRELPDYSLLYQDSRQLFLKLLATLDATITENT